MNTDETIKIELKLSSFKRLITSIGSCNSLMKDPDINDIYYEELLPLLESEINSKKKE